MFPRFLSRALIVLGTLFLVLSVSGIAAIWIYRTRVTNEALSRLEAIDQELTQAQSDLDNGKSEIQRTLRIVEAAQTSLDSLKQQLVTAKQLTDQVSGVLNADLIPGLQGVRGKIDQLRGTIQNLRNSLKTLNTVPFLNLNLPGDEFLAGLINDVDALDKQIAAAQQLTQQASTFTGDASYLMGGDLSDTRQRLQNLLNTVTEYDLKVAGWHAQVRSLIAGAPRWINETAAGLTLFLLWFGLSQFGLILHGLAMEQGVDPLAVLGVLGRKRSGGTR
ncbi:MAG TPA: hypothetical protein VF784_16035 [Anaerolineales bacterium]